MLNNFRYVESPWHYYRAETDPPSLFLGGGIPNVAPWHDRVIDLLSESGVPMVVLNPRRERFPVGDPGAVEQQVAWEHRHLHLADLTLFWFAAPDPAAPVPASSVVQPTTLFELGVALGEGRRVVVGADPAYPRMDILRHQLSHYPDVLDLRHNLAALVAAVVFELSASTHLDGEQQ